MEIVSEPDLRTPEEAYNYLSALKQILQYLDVSDCDMEKGSMRCDANVSIRPKGSDILNSRVELKNMNSFRGVQDAIEYETARQIEATGSGERIVQETRLWDADRKESRPMRSKEQAHDYRYFPEPDLLPLVLTREQVEEIRRTLPELPQARQTRFQKEYALSEYDAEVLTQDRDIAGYYEQSASALADLKSTDGYKQVCTDNDRTARSAERCRHNIRDSKIQPEQIAGLARLILNNTISGKIAKTVLRRCGRPLRIRKQLWKK